MTFGNNHLIPPESIVLGKEIGSGGFGTVFEAMFNGTPVAVKQTNNASVGRDVLESFKQEFDTVMQLRHPNIVLVLGVCFSPKISIVMELLKGGKYPCNCNVSGSLQKLVHFDAAFQTYSLKQKLNIAIQVARGLTYLHFKKVLHGDIKPGNFTTDQIIKRQLM